MKSVTRATAAHPPRLLIHGQEGVGKTTLAAQFPSPVFLQTEDGCPGGIQIDTFGLLTAFPDVRAALMALASEPHEFGTVVVDALDALEGLIWRDLCAQQGWASIEAPGYGKGYVAADNWWRDVLSGLEYLRRERGMMIVLLAHSAIETINDPRTASYTSYQLRLHKRARGLVQDWVDAIGFLAPDLHVKEDDAGFGKRRARADGGSQRWLHWEGRPSFVAKNRYCLPAKMPVPADFSYGALASYFPQPSRSKTAAPRKEQQHEHSAI
jgi:hypothetical protein